MRSVLLAAALLGLHGCALISDQDHLDRLARADQDGDGFVGAEDCDDLNADAHPGAAEVCDNIDNDCNELIDDNPPEGVQAWRDADGDGFGDGDAPVKVCEAAEITPENRLALRPGDCHDDNAAAYPNSHSPEVPGDGVDQDCDGVDFCTDLNCDGYPDLVVMGNQDTEYITLPSFHGGPDGGPTPATALGTRSANAAVAADFNGDGYMDLVISGRTPEVQPNGSYGWAKIHYGSANGIPPETGANVQLLALPFEVGALCAGDVDDNGFPDLLIGSIGAPDAAGGFNPHMPSRLYYNNGEYLGDPLDLPSYGVRSCAMVDVSRDGLPDIFLSGYQFDDTAAPTKLYVAQRHADETLYTVANSRNFAGEATVKLIVDDIDGNGFHDLLLVSARRHGAEAEVYNANSYVYWNFLDGSGLDDRIALATPGATDALVVDLDGDGFKDLVFANARKDRGTNVVDRTSTSLLFWGSTDRRFTGVSYLPVEGATSVAASDFDGDGNIDLAFTSKRWLTLQLIRRATLFRNLIPATRFQDAVPELLDSDDARMVVAADLNADGRDELYFGGSKAVVALVTPWSPPPTLRWFVPNDLANQAAFPQTPTGELDLPIDTRTMLVVGKR